MEMNGDSRLAGLIVLQLVCSNCVLQPQKRHIIGYFDSDTSPDFKVYHKVASILRDDCLFHAAIGSELDSLLCHFTIHNNHVS